MKVLLDELSISHEDTIPCLPLSPVGNCLPYMAIPPSHLVLVVTMRQGKAQRLCRVLDIVGGAAKRTGPIQNDTSLHPELICTEPNHLSSK